MSIIKSNGAGEAGGFKYNGVATRSVRFGVNNLLKNELDAPTNTQKLTLSMWFKRQRDGTEEALAGTNVDNNYIRFEAGGTIRMRDGSINLITTPIYRDTSAWYHIVVAWNLLDTTDADKVIIYVNGVRQALGTSTLPSAENVVSQFNIDGKENYIGAYSSGGVAGYYSGYIAEVNFIDGINIGETSGYLDEFGELKNGVWIPKDTSGLTFGDNGYRLQFANSAVSSASSSTIGADTSGKARHFTSAGILASDCAMPDTPENNFPTMGSFQFRRAFRSQDNALSEGALKVAPPSTYNSIALASMRINEVLSNGSGVYWEVRVDSGGAGNNSYSGVVGGQESSNLTSATGPNTWPTAAVFNYLEGYIYVNTTGGNYGSIVTYAEDDIIGFAIKSDGKFFMHKNGTYFNQLAAGAAQNPVNGANPLATLDLTNDYFPFADGQPGVHYNFGQDSTFAGAISAGGETDANGIGDFAYEVPTGFLALCSANMSEPTIGPNSSSLATDHFNTLLYTGNSTDDRAITGVGFKPDWCWFKKRGSSNAMSHYIVDSARGTSSTGGGTGNIGGLNSNATEAEITTTDGGFASFNNDGFTLGQHPAASGYPDSGYERNNKNNDTYVAWNWKANGGTATATVSESGDNPAAVVQANPTAGFSLIIYTGTGAAGTIAHGLGAVPKMMIIKNRDEADGWGVYHGANTAAPATDYLALNTPAATADEAAYWNDTAPTSSVFTVHNAHEVNANGEKYVAYVFAEVEGYSKMGSYVGNGAAEGSFIYTGFRPAWVMYKRADSSDYWAIFDSVRSPVNVMQNRLAPNYNYVEDVSTANQQDFLSNGFKLRGTDTTTNANGGIYIYMAFAEQPFKYANAR